MCGIPVTAWSRDPRFGKREGSGDGLTKAVVGSILDDMKIQDVTKEYYRSATLGKGAVIYGIGYEVETHQNEIMTAEWLRDTFGGQITLLTESAVKGEKSADYLWNGKLWDLKSVTTEKAANTAIKRGLAQIRANPGGIILRYGETDFSLEYLQAVIDKRMQWLAEGSGADIMIVSRDKVLRILRYKK